MTTNTRMSEANGCGGVPGNVSRDDSRVGVGSIEVYTRPPPIRTMPAT